MRQSGAYAPLPLASPRGGAHIPGAAMSSEVEGRRRAGGRGWSAFLAAGGAVVVVRGGLVALGDAGRPVASPALALDALLPAAAALLMAHVSWRARRLSARLAGAWGALAGAWAAYAGSEALSSFLGASFDTPPGSYVGVALYLVFFPLFLLGLLGLPSVPLTRQERVPLVLDTLIVLLGATLILYVLLVRPALGTGPHQPLRLLMTVAAPAGDLVVLWAFLTLALQHRGRSLPPVLALLGASALCLTATDLLYAYALVWKVPGLWRALGPGWAAAHVLAALASVRQLLEPGDAGARPAARLPARPSRASLYLAYSCLGGVVLVLAGERTSRIGVLGGGLVLAILALVLARKAIGMAEGERLRGELVKARDTLEERVAERTAELEATNLALAAEIEDRKKAEQRITLEVRRLAALRAIDQAITGSFDLGVTLDVFLEKTVVQLGVDAAAVLLLDPVSMTLATRARRGFRGERLGPEPTPIGEGYAGTAALERRLVEVPDVAARPDVPARRRTHESEGFRSCWASPLVARGQVKGVLEVYARGPVETGADWLEFLGTLAGQGAIAVDSTALLERTQRSNVELARAYDSTLRGWALALELRDHETQGHSVRVTETTLRLARALDLGDDELVNVRRGALLHDIGKIAIPDRILLKQGPLTEPEWEVMRRHPVHAFELLSHVSYLRPALDIPYCHHERWDGAGYPRGLAGEQIPLAARLFSVVDNWDALSFERPYRPAWPAARVRGFLEESAGSLLDPEAVRLFLELGG